MDRVDPIEADPLHRMSHPSNDVAVTEADADRLDPV